MQLFRGTRLFERRRSGSDGLEEARAERLNHYLMLAVIGILGLTELLVALLVSQLVGIALFALTGALGALAQRGERFARANREAAKRAFAEHRVASLREDSETGLPNRTALIEHVAREIARCERYGHSLTISVAQVSRLEELQRCWGSATGSSAISHVAETLRRVCRSSDYVARLDDDRFAVVLIQCSREQAETFNDRLALATGNRPIAARPDARLPLYVNLDLSALEFDANRFRGPLDFVSAAGGDPQLLPLARRPQQIDGYELRRRLIGATEQAAPANGVPRRRAEDARVG